MDKTFGVISVASPCKQSWDSMKGDANVRFCGACEKNVYQLDNLTTAEVRELIVAREGKLCWRFFVRRDGTVLTKDCPVGLRRVRQRMFAALATACALVVSTFALGLRSAGFWGASQCMGAWSTRVSAQGILPVPLQGEAVGFPSDSRPLMGAPPPTPSHILGGPMSPEPEHVMGKRQIAKPSAN